MEKSVHLFFCSIVFITLFRCVQLIYGQYAEYIQMSYRYVDCVHFLKILTGSFTGVGVGRADVEGFTCEVNATTRPVVTPGML